MSDDVKQNVLKNIFTVINQYDLTYSDISEILNELWDMKNTGIVKFDHDIINISSQYYKHLDHDKLAISHSVSFNPK